MNQAASRVVAASTRSPSLVDKAVDTLGRGVIRGDYEPGDLMPPEAEIASSLGISRNVAREAFKILASKGLVRIVQGSGTRIQSEEEWNYLDQQLIGWAMEADQLRDGLIDQLSQLRYIVEPEVAALAAEHASTTEILRLFEAQEAMERHRNEPELAVEADILFHRHLFAAAHNKFLNALLRTVIVILRANFSLAIKADYDIIKFLDEHRVVAEAIHRRDPDAARQAMRGLLDNNRTHLIDMRKTVSGAAKAKAERGDRKGSS